MADDVHIKFGDLRDAKSDLDAIIEEFEKAASRADELENAIGDPYDKNKLRERAEDFEDRWDNKRDQLKEGLKGVRDHIEGIIKGVQDWDADTAASFTPPEKVAGPPVRFMNRAGNSPV